MLSLLALLACSEGTPVDSGSGADPQVQAAPTCGPEGGYHHWLVDSLSFVRIEDGFSDGFDLDGAVSTTGSATGCGLEDLTAPDGTPGIDNAFARLLPVLDNTEFIAAEGLIEASIHNGELVLVPELAGLDADPGPQADDDCVRMALRRGFEAPMAGTDGHLLAGQTLDLDPDFGDVVWLDQAVTAGTVESRPLEVALPLQVLNAQLEFTLLGGAFRLHMLDDGRLEGLFAGGIETAYLLEAAQTENVDPELYTLAESLLGSAADLAPDATGACTQLSVTFRFTAVPVYVFEDALE